MKKIRFSTNLSDFLRTQLWGKITSRVCWRGFRHRIFARLGLHTTEMVLYQVIIVAVSNFSFQWSKPLISPLLTWRHWWMARAGKMPWLTQIELFTLKLRSNYLFSTFFLLFSEHLFITRLNSCQATALTSNGNLLIHGLKANCIWRHQQTRRQRWSSRV